MLNVEIPGARVAYRRDGDGPPLVLVHGTGGDAESNWGAMLDRFAAEWTVIRPEYSGSGATADDGRPLDLAFLAAQVLAAATAAGAERFHLVGFSLGAAVAARLAADHPARVRSLVLAAGFAASDDARLRLEFALWRDLVGRDRATLARLLLLTGFSPEFLSGLGVVGLERAVAEVLATTDWDGMARQIDLDLDLDVWDALPRIVAPTLAIGCALDHMVPPAHARALAAAIPGARYAELPTGHLAPMERPGAFSEVVAAFLREVSGG